MDLTEAPHAVRMLVEVCDDEKFRINSIEIRRRGEGFYVAAYDAEMHSFKYAVYVDGTGEPIVDAS